MPRLIKAAAIVGPILIVLSAWAMFRVSRVQALSVAAPGLPDIAPLVMPDFALVDQDGRPVTLDDLRGRVTVLDFMFTHCPFICPVLTEKMSGLTVALQGTPVQFVSISVDPEHDTPEALRAYARLHEADTTRWRFLTGDKAEVHRIADALLFALGDDPKNIINLPGGETMNNIIHPGWFVIVRPDGTVSDPYRPTEPESLESLLVEARRLAKSAK